MAKNSQDCSPRSNALGGFHGGKYGNCLKNLKCKYEEADRKVHECSDSLINMEDWHNDMKKARKRLQQQMLRDVVKKARNTIRIRSLIKSPENDVQKNPVKKRKIRRKQ